jgi:peptidoglycan/LPS O-acetylase OafA/YrhL
MTEPQVVPESPLRYMPQLDGLRAIAVFMVAWSHWMPEYTAGLPWGHFGVQLFFVLSGFLITGILLRDRPAEGASRLPVVKQFFLRRALRIFPAYYLLLLITWLCNVGESRQLIGWNMAYAANLHLWWTRKFNVLSHFWTLAVEEQFYLIWPWIVLWCRPASLARICTMMVIFAPCFRYGMQVWSPATEPTVLMPSAADALGIGALLAIWHQNAIWMHRLRILQLWICLPAFLIIQAAPFWTGQVRSQLTESIRILVMVIAFSGLIDQAARGIRGPIGQLLASQPLMVVGRISYGVYLIHNFVPELLMWFLDWSTFGRHELTLLHPGLRFCVLWVTTLVLAGLSWLFLEEPCLQLKHKFSSPPREPVLRTDPV